MQSFKVHSEAQDVAIIVNSNFTHFKKVDENVWHLETQMSTKCDFKIGLCFEGNSYETAFQYKAIEQN